MGRRTNSKSTSRCTEWKRWISSGISKRRIAGSLGFALMSVLSIYRMVRYGARRPKDVRIFKKSKLLPPWTPGVLDIHHLQVGSSVSTFVVMPDATTMLIDAGDVNVAQTLLDWSKQGPPFDTLNLRHPYPDDSKTPVEWIIEYMKDFWPSQGTKKLELDYLLLTHFHSDHFGDGNTEQRDRPKSPSGKYILSGIPELASKIGVKRIIDRGFPDYNVPQDLSALHDKSMDNYLQFVRENKDSIHFEQFQVGSSQQIQMLKNKSTNIKWNFRIQVIKSGMQVLAPFDRQLSKGDPTPVLQIPGGEAFKENLHGSENSMSAAIVIEYGHFRYYEGADQDVIRDSNGNIVFDSIGPTARAAGKVDVATLNHHGHGVSLDYLAQLDPRIMILQGWSTDQPPTKSMELLVASPPKGGIARQIFATDIFQERLNDLGPSLSKLFQSKSGHVVVRVNPANRASNLRRPGGTKDTQQAFEIVILDGKRQIRAKYGKFRVRATQ